MNEKDLIQEAKDRGYRMGTIIDYESPLDGTDTLGSGEFCMENGKLIKYEKELKYDNPNFRRFDTIWDKEKGWVKIATKKHGLQF